MSLHLSPGTIFSIEKPSENCQLNEYRKLSNTA